MPIWAEGTLPCMENMKGDCCLLLSSDAINSKIIKPDGTLGIFRSDSLKGPTSREWSAFTSAQLRTLALEGKKIWQIQSFKAFQDVLAKLAGEKGGDCLGNPACRVEPNAPTKNTPVVDLDLHFPLPATGGGVPNYHGKHLRLKVHADCHRCALDNFLKETKADELCVAEGVRDGHKLGRRGENVANLQIFVRERH